MHHNVCRDYLAIELGGQAEVSGVVEGRADVALVVLPGQGTSIVVEVKSPSLPPAQFIQAIAQVKSYRDRWPGDCVGRLHWILSVNRLKRNRQLHRINLHRPEWEPTGIEVTTEIARPLPDCYELGGIKFPLDSPNQFITEQCAQIRDRFLIAEYLDKFAQRFLTELSRAIYSDATHVSVKPITVNNSLSIMVLAHTSGGLQVVDLAKARQQWLKLTHHRWWSLSPVPQSVLAL